MLETSIIFSPTSVLWIGVYAGAFVAGFAGFEPGQPGLV